MSAELRAMSYADYEALPGVRISRLLAGRRSPLHLRHALSAPDCGTDATRFGTAVHLAAFEEAQFRAQVCASHWNLHTNAGRAERDAWLAGRPGRIVLSPADYARARATAASIEETTTGRELLKEPALAEAALTWTDATTGVACKGRLDRMLGWHGETWVLDLKTCRDAGEYSFRYAVEDYGYHARAAFYLDGLDAAMDKRQRRFCWIAVESDPPHAVAFWEPSDALLQAGRELYGRLLGWYKRGLETGVWPGYPDGPEPLVTWEESRNQKGERP